MMNMNVNKNGVETIEINGLQFRIGYLSDAEFAGYVCEMKTSKGWEGCLFVDENEREFGWRSGIFATDAEIEAIKEAKKIMKEKYGSNRFHG